MADFRSFADNLDQRQPLTHASIASLDDDDDNEKDEDIHIVLSINVDDVDLTSLNGNDDNDKDEVIHIVLSIDDDDIEFEVPPPRHFPVRVQLCPSWGGNVRCRLPTCCRLLSRLPSRHKRRHADLNGLVAALVVGTALGHPITWTRPFPPTLSQ